MLLLKPPEETLLLPAHTPPARLWQRLRLQDYIYTLLPLGALILWLFSLHLFNMRQMNDLGLISVMPPSAIIALVLITISFCFTLQDARFREPLILLHIALLIFMLYGVTALVEGAPRFSSVYKHVGYTDYFVRNGVTDPGLALYFSWPTFFILGALFTQIAGFHDATSFVAWAPLAFNVLYFGPLFLIQRSLTRNRRVIWLAVWIFFLVNWIGQDYYSPQGMNIFLYLVIIAILLHWFKRAPGAREKSGNWFKRVFRARRVREKPGRERIEKHRVEEHKNEGMSRWEWGKRKVRWWVEISDTIVAPSTFWQKVGLLCVLFGVFAFDVSSHPLTPFFVLISVTALVFFRRIQPFWLPFPMVIMTAWWVLVVGYPFLAGHSNMVIGSFGLLDSAVTLNVTSRVTGSQGHVLITELCLIMTALFWLLAFLGGVRRLFQGYRDLTAILLAAAPFPLLIAQSYGGEMLFRIYMIALPFMAFFVATLFYERASRLPTRWLTVGLIVLNVVFLGLFLFTRYGNERNDYVSTQEVAAVRTLYSIAPRGSILIRGWEGGPWEFQNIEKYDSYSLDDSILTVDIVDNEYEALNDYVKQRNPPAAYMIFMRTTQASFAATSGLPPDRLRQFEHELLASGDCKLIFKNKDAEIIEFV